MLNVICNTQGDVWGNCSMLTREGLYVWNLLSRGTQPVFPLVILQNSHRT